MEGNTSGVDDSEVIAERGEQFYEAFVQDGGLRIGALLAGHTRGTRGRHGLGAITFGFTAGLAAIFCTGSAACFMTATTFGIEVNTFHGTKYKVI